MTSPLVFSFPFFFLILDDLFSAQEQSEITCLHRNDTSCALQAAVPSLQWHKIIFNALWRMDSITLPLTSSNSVST